MKMTKSSTQQLVRRLYQKGEGPYTIDHLYYKDGTSKTIMANSYISWNHTLKDDRPRIVFCTIYRSSERRCGNTVLPKKEMQIKIHTPDGYKYVETLNRKLVSQLGLNPRKTWFGVGSLSEDKFTDIIGFRRVPRKWVPELDRMLIKID